MRRIAAVVVALGLGCGSSTEVRIFGEAFAEQGIPAGEMRDGWSVRFEEFLVSVGDIRISGDANESAPGWYVFDITQDSSGAGHEVTALAGVPGDRGTLHYRLAEPPRMTADGNATADQTQTLVDGGFAVYARGTATRGAEQMAFDWGFPLDLAYDCAVSAPTRGEASVEITMHADHLFADDLEVAPQLAFDAIRDADFNGDSLVVPAELRDAKLATLSEYGTSRGDIEDLWVFIGNLATSMAHVDGEGTCDKRFVPDAYLEAGSPTHDASEEGGALFAQHCASCHGETGEGRGPASTNLKPAASNLAAARGAAAERNYIRFRIEKGGDFFPYASSMPAYEDVLTDDEIGLLVGFVHGLGSM